MPKSSTLLFLSGIASILSTGAIASTVYLYQARPALRVAYVDTDKLFNSYQAMLTARHVYQGEKQEWEHNLETLAQETQKALVARQRLGKNDSPQQRAASDEAFRLKQQQFMNYQNAVQKQDPAEMQRLTQPVVAAANRYLAAYGKRHQYALVLSASGPADVVYVAEPLDITASVIQGLNQELTDSLRHSRHQEVGK